MKTIITTSLVGAIALALPAVAENDKEIAKPEAQFVASADHVTLLNNISDRITAQPEEAGEIVKQAILQTKADKDLILQIAKVAVLAAPEQAEAVLKVIIALAPDAKEEVEIVIASVLQGDQVAQSSSDAANAAQDSKEPDAGNEPEGREPEKNTVWLTNQGILFEGRQGHNSLPSKVQNTAISPNVNHNTGAHIRGGGTVVIRPNPTTTTAP